MDHSQPDSSVHGILQARILEWVAIPFSRGIFPTRGSNLGLLHCRKILYHLSCLGSPFLHTAPQFILPSPSSASSFRYSSLNWEVTRHSFIKGEGVAILGFVRHRAPAASGEFAQQCNRDPGRLCKPAGGAVFAETSLQKQSGPGAGGRWCAWICPPLFEFITKYWVNTCIF